jgi:hypothetical protein
MHPASDKLALDHTDDGTGYLGFSHDSPCQTCGERCNCAAGGRHSAELMGKTPRNRRCAICGMAFRAYEGGGGNKQATCGKPECVTAIRRIRRERKDDPSPPALTGREW